MYLTDLADVLRAEGLPVKEVTGWKTRGRRGGEQMDGVRAIICHHTAGPATGESPSRGVVTYGRPGLGGPLSQMYLSRSGVWHVVAAGKANHAGAVSNVDYSNAYAIGVEAEATGTDEWPPDQYVSYAHGVAALVNHWKLSTSTVLGHKEVGVPLGRKSDPNFRMAAFRVAVDRARVAQRATRDNPRVAPRFPLKRVLQVEHPMLHGEDVKTVQRIVRTKVDGWYGPDTAGDVKRWQRAHGLSADGEVGPKTAAKMGLRWAG